MSKIYKTARGTSVDMDMLRLANESTIAIGNMKVNARGDQLGKGGKVVKTRSQVMSEYHKLNTPMAEDFDIDDSVAPKYDPQPTMRVATPVPEDLPIDDSAPADPSFVKPRGSFAESIAKETEITQELLEPATSRNSTTGVSRI